MPTLKSRLAELLGNGAFDLPMPGAGATASRHHALAQFGATDLSLARLAEAHTDAIAILAEAGKTVRPQTLYGVWASDAPPSRVTCERLNNDEWRIDGIKQFCSGAGLVGAALVTANQADRIQLFDIPVDGTTVIAQPPQWKNPAFAADPRDTAATGRTRGLKVRHLIERACTEVLDRFGRATGPQLLAYDSTVVRQHAALTLYIRQCHAERDLETIPE